MLGYTTFVVLVFNSGIAAQNKYYDLLRYNDTNFLYLRTEKTDKNFFNPIKYIRLNKGGRTFLTLGGEIRENYQWIKNENWGDIPPDWKDDNGFIWHRIMIHADLKFDRKIRVFAQLKNTAVVSRAGGPRPVTDKDDISLHQAFVDYNFGGGDNRFTIRAGRQEHNFGWGKLVSVREGPNNRQNFDGDTLFHTNKFCNSRLFFANDVSVANGAFDNQRVKDKYIFGLYSNFTLRSVPSLLFEPYYIRSNTPAMVLAGKEGTDKRNSAGLRIASRKQGILYELEAVYQWGRFSVREISAYSVVGMIGYEWKKSKWMPKIQLWGGVSTGDKSNSERLNTYNPLYPRPPFSQAFAFGVTNINAAQLECSLRPLPAFRVSAGVFLLKRNSHDDGIYTPGVTPIRPMQWQNNLAEFSNSLADYNYIDAEYFAGRHWQFNFQAAVVQPGRFIRQTGAGKTINYLLAQATFRF